MWARTSPGWRARRTGHLGGAGVGIEQGGQDAHRGRLPRAVGPEQAEHRALGHGQVQTVERADLAVGLDQSARADHVRHGSPPSSDPSRHRRGRRRHRAPRCWTSAVRAVPRRPPTHDRRATRAGARSARCSSAPVPAPKAGERPLDSVASPVAAAPGQHVEQPVDDVHGRTDPPLGDIAQLAGQPEASGAPERRAQHAIAGLHRPSPAIGVSTRRAAEGGDRRSPRRPGRRRSRGTPRSGTSPTAGRRNRSCRRRARRRGRSGRRPAGRTPVVAERRGRPGRRQAPPRDAAVARVAGVACRSRTASSPSRATSTGSRARIASIAATPSARDSTDTCTCCRR